MARSKAEQLAPPPTPMTFEEICIQFKVTPDERWLLAWHLGQYRMRKTVESLAMPGWKGILR